MNYFCFPPHGHDLDYFILLENDRDYGDAKIRTKCQIRTRDRFWGLLGIASIKYEADLF